MTAQEIVRLLSATRFRLNREKDTQSDIEDHLVAHGIAFKREERLSDRDIPDFILGRTVIEVKIRGARQSIYRQLLRYAEHDVIDELILATNVPMGLPQLINGKPVHVVSLARAWL